MPEENTKYTTWAVWMESVLKERDSYHDPYFDRNTYNVQRGVFFNESDRRYPGSGIVNFC
jgi:hypothetical protein